MKIIFQTLSILFVAFFMTVPAFAGAPLVGQMQKMKVYERDQWMPELIVDGMGDTQYFLSNFAGKVVLVNLWATWCPPCVAELGSLDALEEKLGGDKFKVLAISLDDGMTPTDIQKFFAEKGITHLQPFVDHENSTKDIPELAGLPTSYVVNNVGNTVARYEGDANWSSPEAVAVLQHYIDKYIDLIDE